MFECSEKRVAGIRHLFDHRKSFQTVHRRGGLDQSGGSHHFHFAREVRPVNFQKSVRLVVRLLQELVDEMQIHKREPANRKLT